jgi:outer membrane receptor for ferrienterochelin and colicin
VREVLKTEKLQMKTTRMGTAIVCSCLALWTTVFLAPRAAAQAQAGTGQIVGTVYDASRSFVAQASVTLSAKDTGLQREEKTDEEGGYRFALLPVGNYTLTFNAPGMKTYKVNVEVTVGAAETVNAYLQVGGVTESIEVTAQNVIESTAPSADALIGVKAIEELPINGRRFQDFVTLTPTVQIEPQRQGISFVGQRGINGNVTIDGADYNEPFFGGIRGGERSNDAFTIPQEAISQFQVVASGYSVEFGRSSGGIVNATTKSGSNNLHGSAFLFARNGSLAEQDAFGRDAITSLYQEGGSLGGRIKRDKAFFFAAFEDQQNNNPHVVVFHRLDSFTPAATEQEAFNFYQPQQGPFTQTNDAITGFGRLDYNFNQNHRVSLSYHYSKNTGQNAVSTGDAISPETSRAQSNNGTEGDRTNTVVGQWTGILSPRFVIETRGQYSLENRPRLSNSTLTGISDAIGTTGARNFLPTTLDDYRVQLAGNATWTLGKHAIKFGGEYDFVHANQFFFFNQFGVFNVNTPSGTTTASTHALLQLLSSNPGVNNRFDSTLVNYSVNIGNGLLNADLKQVALFVQDTWRLTPRLTVTAGFRWEGYINPQPDTSNSTLYNQVKNFPFPIGLTNDPANLPNNYDQYMPRLGFAWDPAGNAKTVIRANTGFFYAPTPLIVLAAPLNNYRAIPGDLSVTLPLALPPGFVCTPLYTGDTCKTVYSQLLRIGVDLNQSPLTNLPKITPAQITQIATALGLANPNPFAGSAPISAANDYKSPRAFQWSAGIEREVAKGLTLGADFNYVNTVHLERDRNLNLPAPVTCTALSAVCTKVDLSLRPCFGVRGGAVCTQQRPIPTLGDVTIRQTNARSRYDGLTLRSNYRRGRVQFQAYYTLSYNYSDDDNERLASGFDYDNSFNLGPEYGFSRLDARHNAQVNGLIDLPWGFTISSLGHFRSGRPIDALVGFSDINGDNNSFGDRAFQAPGVSFRRNSFRDLRQLNVDMRIAKLFHLPWEGKTVSVTADFFNLFNAANILYQSGTPSPFQPTTNYGLGVDAAGNVLPAATQFRQLTDPSFCSKNSGCYNTFNSPGSPFTAQLGLRFAF